MITALFMKHSLLPEERTVQVLELPSYHFPKLRNVLINTWIRVKAFVFRVGKFIIPMVLVLKVLSVWGIDGTFNQQPIERSLLAAGGRAITPVLAPMGIHEDQWPATVALLTGVLHKVVIVSTLESIYLDAKRALPAAAEQNFNLVKKIKQAAMTIPQNLKILIGLNSASTNGAHSGLAPALASRFDGKVGALAYLILLLCYPCIATTAATERETNRRWTGLMVFWTLWVLSMVTYFIILGVASAYYGMWARRGSTSDVVTKA
jgi:ferrous iron transport protein B